MNRLIVILLLLIIAGTASAAEWVVYPDGSGPNPTIDSAVGSAAPGDLITLMSGTFTGPGNRDVPIDVDLDINAPFGCVIDCEGVGRAFWMEAVEVSITGVTIRNGQADEGGALWCQEVLLELDGCVFEDNTADDLGGAIYGYETSAQTVDLVFSGNRAGQFGGGIYLIADSSFSLYQSTMVRNGAPNGGAVFAEMSSTCSILNTIIAFGTEGVACSSYYGTCIAQCSNVYGNRGGDWVHDLSGQNGVDGNMSVDPYFCDPMATPINVNLFTDNWWGTCGRIGARHYQLLWPQPIYGVAADGSGMFETIQDAFDNTLYNCSILLEDGVYTGPGNRDLEPLISSVQLLASRSGDATACVLDCQSSATYDEHVVVLLEGHPIFKVPDFEDLTFTGGDFEGRGGAVQVTGDVESTFRRCRFVDNEASSRGGAVNIEAVDGAPALVDFEACEFIDNYGFSGGAISAEYWDGRISDCRFEGVLVFRGGALYTTNSTLLITGTIFDGNPVNSGGGALFLISSPSTISDCEFRNNSAAIGGAIYLSGEDHHLSDVWIESNLARVNGGAICCDMPTAGDQVTMTNCTLLNNSSYDSGSAIEFTNSGTLILSHSSLHGHVTSDPVPGTASQIHMGDGGILDISYCMITGGIDGPPVLLGAGATVDMDRTNVWGNDAGNFTGALSGFYGLLCNQSEDPIYCDAPGSVLTLREDSPCLPAGNLCGLLYGAWGQGCEVGTAIEDAPVRLALGVSNHPNPFNPATTIRFVLPRASQVDLGIYDVAGRLVRKLIGGVMPDGVHDRTWDGSDQTGRPVGSGVYLARLVTEDGTVTHRMLMVK